MTVNFETFRLVDYKPPLSLEETFKLFTTWSDILATNFDSLIDMANMNVTGTIASGWSGDLIDVTLPSSFELNFHKDQMLFGVWIYGGGGAINYDVRTDDGYLNFYSNDVLVYTAPKYMPVEADVRVVYRQQQFSNDVSETGSPVEVWNSITVYGNGRMILTYIDKKALPYSDLQVGLLSYGTDITEYSDVRVPELAETAEFGTLDQGTNAMSGLNRSIEGRYLRFFVRQDGSFRAYRVKSIDSSLTLPAEELEVTGLKDQYTDLSTHIRMVGAYTWAEAIDPELMAKYGHRFTEANNPMLLTEDECALEAARSIKRMQENAFAESIRTSVLPLLEIDDRVSTPEGEWLISNYGFNVEEGGYISQDTQIRKYVWGE
jgi:hypothetical protein